jgi:hypothetical protein
MPRREPLPLLMAAGIPMSGGAVANPTGDDRNPGIGGGVRWPSLTQTVDALRKKRGQVIQPGIPGIARDASVEAHMGASMELS